MNRHQAPPGDGNPNPPSDRNGPEKSPVRPVEPRTPRRESTATSDTPNEAAGARVEPPALDRSRRYLVPVARLDLPDEPDVVHLSVYEWLPKFGEWATGLALCGASAEQGALPDGTVVTCTSCLEYKPRYERALTPIPAEIKRIVDEAAGKDHSATGAVMRCLQDVLAAHTRIRTVQAEAARDRYRLAWESAEEAWRDATARAEQAEAERNRLAATLREVLAEFVHETHPGRRCLQSGHVPVATVDRWRAALTQPTTPAPEELGRA